MGYLVVSIQVRSGAAGPHKHAFQKTAKNKEVYKNSGRNFSLGACRFLRRASPASMKNLPSEDVHTSTSRTLNVQQQCRRGCVDVCPIRQGHRRTSEDTFAEGRWCDRTGTHRSILQGSRHALSYSMRRSPQLNMYDLPQDRDGESPIRHVLIRCFMLEQSRFERFRLEIG